MGSVAVPTTGTICVDANIVIYRVEKHPRYSPVLRPLWTAVAAGQARVLASELILLETLIGPYRANDPRLASDYETFFGLPGIELIPISSAILREAARLRAQILRLRSPDAIPAATAQGHGATTLLSNDPGFRNVPGLNVIVLDDVITASATP
jgi:predicted nucleic acid-binding protein